MTESLSTRFWRFLPRDLVDRFSDRFRSTTRLASITSLLTRSQPPSLPSTSRRADQRQRTPQLDRPLCHSGCVFASVRAEFVILL